MKKRRVSLSLTQVIVNVHEEDLGESAEAKTKAYCSRV